MGDRIPSASLKKHRSTTPQPKHASQETETNSRGRKKLNIEYLRRTHKREIVAVYNAVKGSAEEAAKAAHVRAIFLCQKGPHGCGAKCAREKCLTMSDIVNISDITVHHK